MPEDEQRRALRELMEMEPRIRERFNFGGVFEDGEGQLGEDRSVVIVHSNEVSTLQLHPLIYFRKFFFSSLQPHFIMQLSRFLKFYEYKW